MEAEPFPPPPPLQSIPKGWGTLEQWWHQERTKMSLCSLCKNGRLSCMSGRSFCSCPGGVILPMQHVCVSQWILEFALMEKQTNKLYWWISGYFQIPQWTAVKSNLYLLIVSYPNIWSSYHNEWEYHLISGAGDGIPNPFLVGMSFAVEQEGKGQTELDDGALWLGTSWHQVGI